MGILQVSDVRESIFDIHWSAPQMNTVLDPRIPDIGLHAILHCFA
jgi:hypothetical protein